MTPFVIFMGGLFAVWSLGYTDNVGWRLWAMGVIILVAGFVL